MADFLKGLKSIKGNLAARKAYMSHARAIQAGEKQDYANMVTYEQKALADYDAAARKGMSKPAYFMAYSVLLMRTGNYTRAMEMIREAEKTPNLSMKDQRTLTMDYAICQWKLGNLDRAIGAMRELLKNYKNSNVYGSLGYMLIEKGDKTGDYSEAKKINDEAMDYDDEDAVVLDNVGQYYMRLNDTDKARIYFEKALEIRPVQVDSMYYLARIKQAAGDIPGAKELIDKAVTIHFSALSTVTPEMLSDFQAELSVVK